MVEDILREIFIYAKVCISLLQIDTEGLVLTFVVN